MSEANERPAKTPSALTARIEVWIAAILMVISFGAGFLVSQVTEEEPAPATIEQQFPGMPPGVVPAPPLTDDQLSGQLPEGHVPVDPDSPAADKKDDDK